MAERSRGVRAAVVVLVGVAVLSAVGWPGEVVTVTAGPVAGPWRPPGRGTPSIDVLGDVPSGAELFGDVAVSVSRRGVAAVRVGGGGRWTYQRLWGDDLVDWVRVDDRRGAAVWRDGRVTLVDVPTGRVVWRADLPAGPFAAAGRTLDGEWRSMWTLSVARPGMLVILHAYRVADGGLAWRRPLERPAGTSQDVLTDGRVVYAAADERTVLALDARTGRSSTGAASTTGSTCARCGPTWSWSRWAPAGIGCSPDGDAGPASWLPPAGFDNRCRPTSPSPTSARAPSRSGGP
ncbi:PQQ-binding-like beta-propeller repeat protein [Nonomuraea sp. NPDC047529]|uniref:outer membrane protein assembly factor BamB family protein n=1 Tax=Nonomuraea sp. NPDC047529 TaxID=3155623 RepID=UPI00340CBC5A